MRTILALLMLLGLLFGCSDNKPQHISKISKTGQISILTLNIAGLPDFLSDRSYSKERMYGISNMANAYDVVAYQEDFFWSAYLDQHSSFESIERGVKGPLAWPILSKSGLTLQTSGIGETRFHAYSTCFGYRKHANDCWAAKGVMCTRAVQSGIVLDVCTTHMDAGNNRGDAATRDIQAAEYMRFLPEPVTDKPWLLIEMGDYNMTKKASTMQLLMLGKEVVISDMGGPKEVDYIMITTNKLLDATVVRAGRAEKFDGWSDHPAIEAVLNLIATPL